jgi:hypothetical protein
MKRYVSVLVAIAGIILLQIVPQQKTAAAPGVEFLGEGGSYTIEAGKQFIVKRLGPFVFANESGPTYTAAAGERVWASTAGAPNALRPGTWLDLGEVPENCAVSYLAIDDDPDDRINVFYVGGTAVHEMPQGMVTGGQFKTPKAGSLRLFAADSIGIWVDQCRVEEPPPTPTVEATATATAEITATASATPQSTPIVPQLTATPTPTQEPTRVTPTPTATKKPRLPACLRINFEVSGGEALAGTYEVREVGGRLLYSWYAQSGWRDSGWIRGIDISFENVYIEVFYVPADGSTIKMDIHNPAPGTAYGWLSRGSCHALEVGWPDPTITPTATPDAFDGYNDEFDREALDLQGYIWPEIQPAPSSTPASSLRG